MTMDVTTYNEAQLVLDVLTMAGARGASHEDFVEAGLAGEYVAVIRRLVDDDALTVRTDFTTGQLRWAMVAGRRLCAA
jgi:hypothetical protein